MPARMESKSLSVTWISVLVITCAAALSMDGSPTALGQTGTDATAHVSITIKLPDGQDSPEDRVGLWIRNVRGGKPIPRSFDLATSNRIELQLPAPATYSVTAHCRQPRMRGESTFEVQARRDAVVELQLVPQSPSSIAVEAVDDKGHPLSGLRLVAELPEGADGVFAGRRVRRQVATTSEQGIAEFVLKRGGTDHVLVSTVSKNYGGEAVRVPIDATKPIRLVVAERQPALRLAFVAWTAAGENESWGAIATPSDTGDIFATASIANLGEDGRITDKDKYVVADNGHLSLYDVEDGNHAVSHVTLRRGDTAVRLYPFRRKVYTVDRSTPAGPRHLVPLVDPTAAARTQISLAMPELPEGAPPVSLLIHEADGATRSLSLRGGQRGEVALLPGEAVLQWSGRSIEPGSRQLRVGPECETDVSIAPKLRRAVHFHIKGQGHIDAMTFNVIATILLWGVVGAVLVGLVVLVGLMLPRRR